MPWTPGAGTAAGVAACPGDSRRAGGAGAAAPPPPAWLVLVLGRPPPARGSHRSLSPPRHVFQRAEAPRPLRPHTGICNSRSAAPAGGAGGAGGAAAPSLCLPLSVWFWVFFLSLVGCFVLNFLFLLTATKGSEAGGVRAPPGRGTLLGQGPPTLGQGHPSWARDSPSPRVRAPPGQGRPGSDHPINPAGWGWRARGPRGEGGGRALYRGVGSQHPPPTWDPPVTGFQRGGLSPAALGTAVEPCECSCAPPAVSGEPQPRSPQTPSRSRSPRGGPAAAAGRSDGRGGDTLRPTAVRGPDTPKPPEFALKPRKRGGELPPAPPPAPPPAEGAGGTGRRRFCVRFALVSVCVSGGISGGAGGSRPAGVSRVVSGVPGGGRGSVLGASWLLRGQCGAGGGGGEEILTPPKT